MYRRIQTELRQNLDPREGEWACKICRKRDGFVLFANWFALIGLAWGILGQTWVPFLPMFADVLIAQIWTRRLTRHQIETHGGEL